MIGYRKLKSCSTTVFLLGLVVLALSYIWFFEQRVPKTPQVLQQAPLDLSSHPDSSADIADPQDQHQPQPDLPDRPESSANSAGQGAVVGRVPGSEDAQNAPQGDLQGAFEPDGISPSDLGEGPNPLLPSGLSEKEKEIAKRIVAVKTKEAEDGADSSSSSSGGGDDKSLLQDVHYLDKLDKQNMVGNGVTRKVDIRLLHRSFSLTGLAGGNMYVTDEYSVVHVASFVDRSSMTALMAMTLSVMKNTGRSRNVTFHFVTPPVDRALLKSELDSNTALSNLAYEIIEFPPEWAQDRNMMEFAPFRLSDLLPYLGGRVIILDPYVLVMGDIRYLADTPILLHHYVAMATLCNTDPAATTPDERYMHYLNFSHEAIAKLQLMPDTCMPSPAVMVVSMTQFRLNNVRRRLWEWMHKSEESPVFLAREGVVSSKSAYAVVYHNYTSLLKPQWYTRLDEQSAPPDSGSMLYHWVGKGEPWDPQSPATSLWQSYLVSYK